ncbi:unnamed protein product [Protopolystoma xenopodis]|uniref:Uncharacterized protein n=1 Tax=Protopolystoma xenopodis TaxID=117903 RepID=A0A3S5FBN2_9PLAT|nr:unnamed protein product [Protopolystoma xenopodis]
MLSDQTKQSQNTVVGATGMIGYLGEGKFGRNPKRCAELQFASPDQHSVSGRQPHATPAAVSPHLKSTEGS